MAGNGSRLVKPVKIGSLMPSILENLLTRAIANGSISKRDGAKLRRDYLKNRKKP